MAGADHLSLGAGVRQSLPEQLVGALLQAIVDRRLAPGAPLPTQAELAEEFRVSRNVVREALADLAGRGVISRGPGGEPVVQAPGVEQLRELLRVRISQDDIDIDALIELRLPIEVQSARLAAERRDDGELAAVEAAFATLAGQTDEVAFQRADAAFHRSIAAATGNPLFPLVLDSISDLLTDMRRAWYAVERATGGLPVLVTEHRRVLDALRAGDIEGAGAAMSDHLLIGLERIRAQRAASTR